MILREGAESPKPRPDPRTTSSTTPLPLPPPPRRPAPVHQFDSAASSLQMPTTSAASSLSRARQKASALFAQSSTYIAPKINTLSNDIHAKIGELKDRREGWETPPGVVTTPKGVRTRGKQPSADYFAPSSRSASPARVGDVAAELKTQAPAPSRGWGLGGLTSYFTGASREARDRNFYSEEKVVSFPGWATLRPSAHSASEPALVLEILAHGYAYRLRPISQASRSQRIFYSLAKSFAALPRIPAHLMPAGAQDLGVNDGREQSIDSLTASMRNAALSDENKDSVFERLLDIGGREANSEVEAKTLITEEPAEMLTGEGEPDSETQKRAPPQIPPKPAHLHLLHDDDIHTPPIVSGPSSVSRRPRIASRPSASGPSSANNSPPDSPLHRSFPQSMNGPRRKGDRASTMPVSPTNATFSKSPTTSGTSTPRSNPTSAAQSRASSPTRTRRPAPTPPGKDEWPKPFSYTDEDLPRLHANLQARLTAFFGQKLSSRKVRISIYPDLEEGTFWDKPLATKVISTNVGGAFRTNLEVRSKDLRRLLEEKGQSVDYLDNMKVKVVTELLEQESVGDVLGAGHFVGHQGLSAVAEDETMLVVGRDGGARVISDIDDTIKWTEVLGGTKKIFRNVFVRELHEIRVPGMADWYRAMEAKGALFHYVSNSPWELWPVVQAFLHETAFPLGSVTLKEYGGASSAIAKLWEEPGMRKRAGVEAILKEFPHCQFILVGDSGEQDLNLYVALAQAYPQQVLMICIRDVTTPFAPDAHPPDIPSGRATPSSSSTPSSRRSTLLSTTSSTPSKKPRSVTSDGTFPASRPPSPPLIDVDSDALSPNNPLRPELVPGEAQSEEGAALVEHFYERIVAAEKALPPHIPLRIFRHGKECQAEGVHLISQR